MKREFIPNLPHHIIVRGNNRRRLFSYPTDYRRFLWHVVDALAQSPCRVHALAALANHVHFIVHVPDHVSVASWVQSFARRYALDRNRRFEASGKLFEQRYFAKPIVDEQQLALTMAYVDANAARHGLVDNPLDHRWSTLAAHVGAPSQLPPGLWTPGAWWLSLGATADGRAAAYRAYVFDSLARNQVPAHHDEIEQAEAVARTQGRQVRRPDRSWAH
jgi:putative transposase